MTTHTAEAAVGEQRITMSYAEYSISVDEDAHTEWVNGEAVFFMPPKTIHQRIVRFFADLLSMYTQLINAGEVLSAPFEMRVTPDSNAREPDILFIANAHRDRLTDLRLEGPADLVVEVISKESVGRDRGDKFYEYEEAGVPEYWIIDPRPGKQRVDVWVLSADGRYQPIVADEHGRFRSTQLPGFWLRADWLTQEPLPDVITTLAEMRGVAPDVVEAFRAAFTQEQP